LKIEIKDKNITVVGLARSGLGAANLLSELGAEVTVTDIKKEDELKDIVPRLSPSVRLALGAHPEDIFLSADMLVVSPGVSLEISPILNARAKGVPVIGELELAYQIITSQNSEFRIQNSSFSNQLQFLAVTGTNGKSTSTALLDFMMRKSRFNTILGGNIGNALTEEIYKRITGSDIGVDYIVVEVSSFQLESIKDFRPKVASILNISPDHLDRYHSFKEYSVAKTRIFENQKEDDFLVLNWDDPDTIKATDEKLNLRNERPNIFYSSRREEVSGIYLKDKIIYCNIPHLQPPDISLSKSHLPLINLDDIKIKGVHNLENAMAASAMALLAGCTMTAVIDSLKEFPGLEHRLEFVREIDGVKYFNDSKGTNVGAVIKSLESFPGPIILIAGGRDKAGDFSRLRHLVKERVKAVVLIGEAAEKIKNALGDIAETVVAKDLRDSVNVSRKMAAKGDVILLSPACASFDMFKNFEDRGMQFKKIVMEMK
jgi:UDP-N-acetylmuramoylalanine--D-glutamate ligase